MVFLCIFLCCGRGSLTDQTYFSAGRPFFFLFLFFVFFFFLFFFFVLFCFVLFCFVFNFF